LPNKAVVNGFTGCDFVVQVRIDIRACRFLIGNLSDVKLITQPVINNATQKPDIIKASEPARNRREK
jgi:hypothetical protein